MEKPSVISHFKSVCLSIILVLSMLTIGCSSSTAPDSVNSQEPAKVSTQPAESSASEERLYNQELDAKGAELEKEEQLKKRKSSDDDMERLD